MKSFKEGFIKGAKEAPLIFFAPIVIAWTLFVEETDKLLAKK